jgi:hypothetical protein
MLRRPRRRQLEGCGATYCLVHHVCCHQMQPRQGWTRQQQQCEWARHTTCCAYQGGTTTLHLRCVKRVSALSWLLIVRRKYWRNQSRALRLDQAVQQWPTHQANHRLIQTHGVFQWGMGQDRHPFQSVVPILRQTCDSVLKHDVGQIKFLHFEMGKGQQSLIHDWSDTIRNILV